MKHANSLPGYFGVVGWLVLAGVGLGVGAFGAGGGFGLVGAELGTASAALRAGSTPSASATGDLGAAGLSSANSGAGSTGSGTSSGSELQASQVVAPSQLPDGQALSGRAPAAEEAKDGDYVPFVPTSIRLPSGRRAAIQPVGVHADGSLQIPPDPDRIGWWTGGAEAGEPYGSIVLAGHVDSAAFGVGVLAQLRQMRPGQELSLGSGSHVQRYRVESVHELPKARLNAGTDLFSQAVQHRLVMITCGGPFNPRTHHYRDNVVLVASPAR